VNELNAIKARLGSISDVSLRHMPAAVQRLLTKDMPILIDIAERVEGLEGLALKIQKTAEVTNEH
jgi:hypothetical protein